MLKRIVFKNLVHFKDKTVIDFQNYPKKQKQKAPVNTSEKEVDKNTCDEGKAVISEAVGDRAVDRKTAVLETGSDKGTAEVELATTPKALTKDINESKESNLNIFVGANFCGKSAVFELLRRCMKDDINF